MKISNRTAVVALALSFTGFSASQASTDLIPTGFIKALNNVVVKGEQATLTWDINYPNGPKVNTNLETLFDDQVNVIALGSNLRHSCNHEDMKTLVLMKLGNSGAFKEVSNNFPNVGQTVAAFPITPVNLGVKFGAQYNNNIVPKLTKLGFGGRYRIRSQSGSGSSLIPSIWSDTRTTENTSKYIKTLFSGDTVPPELLAAAKINSYLVPYINKTSGKIEGLNSTAMLVLMELDYVEGDTSSENKVLKDYQDLALLVNFVSIPK